MRALSKRKISAEGVLLGKDEQMADSLRRIRERPTAVWARRSDHEPGWTTEKCAAYRAEAAQILGALDEASSTLAKRLRARIESYSAYCGIPIVR